MEVGENDGTVGDRGKEHHRRFGERLATKSGGVVGGEGSCHGGSMFNDTREGLRSSQTAKDLGGLVASIGKVLKGRVEAFEP